MEAQTKVQSISSTKLAIATLALLAAGGLAFAAVPMAKKNSGSYINAQGQKCGVNSVSLSHACGKGKYTTASVSCQDGSRFTEGGKGSCKTAASWNRIAAAGCSGRCVAEKAAIVENELVPDLSITGLRVDHQDDGSFTYQVLYVNQGNARARGPFHFSFIVKDENNNEVPLQVNEITSEGYLQDNIDGRYIGPRFSNESFPPLPNGSGVIRGVIPSQIIERGGRTFHVKIDHSDVVYETNEENNKMDVYIGRFINPIVVRWSNRNIQGNVLLAGYQRLFIDVTNPNNQEIELSSFNFNIQTNGLVGHPTGTLRMYKPEFEGEREQEVLLGTAAWIPSEVFHPINVEGMRIPPRETRTVVLDLTISDYIRPNDSVSFSLRERGITWRNTVTGDESNDAMGLPLAPYILVR